MKISVSFDNLEQIKSECLVVFSSDIPSKTLSTLIDSDASVKCVYERGDLPAILGKNILLPCVESNNLDRVLLVSMGKAPLQYKDIVTLCSAVIDTLKGNNVVQATIHLDDLVSAFEKTADVNQISQMFARDLFAKTYSFDAFKKKDEAVPLNKIEVITLNCTDTNSTLQDSVVLGASVGEGINFAKDLGNTPGNVCTPVYLSEKARELAKNSDRLKVEILGEKEIKALKMNAFLSVSQGSKHEAQLIVMNYQGDEKSTKPPVVLIGKGITFDTGGICIKPAADMDEMKFDMCGAASVFGVIKALTLSKLPINVIGIVASAENMPSSSASRPGDIVTSMSGQTIEIINTDAEGRLILCDALTYVERFNPELVVDIATLTGACVVALGHEISGMVSNDDALASQLHQAGLKSLDEVWRLPMNDNFDKQLDSNFADMRNVGGKPAGTITAGCFLARYAKKYSWAHLDVAGTAWKSGKEKGATGRPVSMLVEFLRQKLI